MANFNSGNFLNTERFIPTGPSISAFFGADFAQTRKPHLHIVDYINAGQLRCTGCMNLKKVIVTNRQTKRRARLTYVEGLDSAHLVPVLGCRQFHVYLVIDGQLNSRHFGQLQG